MIYCVVPEPLADELYEKLRKYYEDDPNVTVIVDRRKGERRRASDGSSPNANSGAERRAIRDRRRPRVTGDFPPLASP